MAIQGLGSNGFSGIGLSQSGSLGGSPNTPGGPSASGGSNGSGSIEQSLMKVLQSIMEMMTQLLQGANGGQESGSGCGSGGGSSPSSSNPTPNSFAPSGGQGQADIGNLLKSLGDFASTLGGVFQGGQGASFGGSTQQV